MSHYARRLLFAAVLFAALVGGSACNNKFVKEETLPDTGATLEGTITYNGKEVPYAEVIVKGANGTVAQGRVGDDHKYIIKSVPVGEVQIGVNTASARGDAIARGMQASSGGKEKKKAEPFVEVPEKFASPDTSGLKYTVKSGANTHNIVVK